MIFGIPLTMRLVLSFPTPWEAMPVNEVEIPSSWSCSNVVIRRTRAAAQNIMKLRLSQFEECVAEEKVYLQQIGEQPSS